MGDKATVITVGIQKGGTGKSTTCGMLAYMLANDGHKVLVIDMDSQGNVTDLLTGLDPEEFAGQTIIEAFEEQNIEPYIIEVTEQLHVVPADDYLATLPKLLYLDKVYKGKTLPLALSDLISPVLDNYDYVLIDTPPSLGEPMVNAVCASDYVVILAESSKWALTAIPRFIETVQYAAKEVNPKLQIAGILRTMNDSRRSDSKAFVELIGETYSMLVFDTVIRRKASVGRLSMDGFFDNRELPDALKEYKKFYKELMERVTESK